MPPLLLLWPLGAGGWLTREAIFAILLLVGTARAFELPTMHALLIAAAQKATKTIPIVMTPATDPIGSGFVKTLARPRGQYHRRKPTSNSSTTLRRHGGLLDDPDSSLRAAFRSHLRRS
jgi:hypothetical protein